MDSINLVLKKISLVMFLMALLFQNSFSLLFSSVNGTTSPLIFLSKEMTIAAVIVLTLCSRKKYPITKPDMIVLGLIAYYSVLSFVNFHSINSYVYGVKYFIVPLMLYFIGRYWFHDIDSKTLFGLFTLAIVTVIVFCLGYFILDKGALINLNVGSLFASKGQDVEGIRFIDGFPVNFYSYYGDSRVMRLFGLFFDPLAAGFFLVPLLFLARKQQSRTNRLGWKLIYGLLIMLLLLTQTRAIILAYIVSLIFIRSHGEKFTIIPLKWICMSIALFVVLVAMNYRFLIQIADASTWGHLNAYYEIFAELRNDSVFSLLIGKGIPVDLHIGSESLFVSMAVYNGILYYLFFNLFIFSAFNCLKMDIHSGLTQIVLSSMLVYYLASFTTEHWFATTSSGVFWILLGMAISDDQKVTQFRWHHAKESLENCNNIYAVRP